MEERQRQTKDQEEKQKEKYTNELIEVLQEISVDEKLLGEFLEDILSPSEYRELGVRWQIIKQLDKGIAQRNIAENLNVAIATVTRGSRELADAEGGFRRVLRKVSQTSKK